MNKTPTLTTLQPQQCPGMTRVIKSLEALRLISLTKGDLSTAESLKVDLDFLSPKPRPKTKRKMELTHA